MGVFISGLAHRLTFVGMWVLQYSQYSWKNIPKRHRRPIYYANSTDSLAAALSHLVFLLAASCCVGCRMLSGTPTSPITGRRTTTTQERAKRAGNLLRPHPSLHAPQQPLQQGNILIYKYLHIIQRIIDFEFRGGKINISESRS